MAQLNVYEQLILELVNRARLDPAGEAARFGIGLNDGLSPGTITTAVKQPLAPNGLLVDAARGHSNWMIANDVFSHTGAGGSSPTERMTAALYALTGSWMTGENIAWTGTTGAVDVAGFTAELHENLFRSPGHRTNILEGFFRELGTGVVSGQFTDGTTYNAVMATENFATSGSNYFVSGVTIDDLDSDNFYDIGEARAGITATVRSGATVVGTDTTEPAGGYSVAFGGTGSFSVTFSGGALPASVAATFTAAASNVKVDLAGNSEILSSAHTVLGAGAVDLTLLGAGALNGTGNAANNRITGTAAGNVLDGAGGADTLVGGLGSDTYFIDHAGDVVIELAGEGSDNVVSTLAVNLHNNAALANVEHVTLVGNTNKSAVGSETFNILTGDASNNYLSALNGNDTINAGAGNDRIFGGGGKDTMSGGAGLDTFIFAFNADFSRVNPIFRELITDFNPVDDTIDLNLCDANLLVAGTQDYVFLAPLGAAFTNVAGQLRWRQEDNAGTANDLTIVEGDFNGDGTADVAIGLTGLLSLTSADFVL